HSQLVIAVDTPVIRRRGRGRDQRVGERERRVSRAGNGFGFREGRLSGQLARDRRVRSAVIGDAVAATNDRLRPHAIGKAEAWPQIIGVSIQKARWKDSCKWTSRPWRDRRHAGKFWRRIEIRHSSVDFDVRQRELVSKTQVEREL